MKIFEENIRVVHIPQRSIFPQITLQPGLCRTFSETTLLRPYQGFWGFGEKGHLFSGSWGALANILRDLGASRYLGSKRRKLSGSWGKTNQGAGEKGQFFSGAAGSKDPPPPGRASLLVSFPRGG